MKPELKNANYLIILVYVFVVTFLGFFFVLKNNYLNLHIPIRIGKFVFNEGLAKEAQKVLPGTDYIIHLDDMYLDWTSDKISGIFGYSNQELLAKKNFNLAISSHLTKEQYLNKFLERISKSEDTYTLITERADKSDVLIEVINKTFTYRNQSFLAGKVINYRTPTEEEIRQFELENQ
jgi:hypothetical protein